MAGINHLILTVAWYLISWFQLFTSCSSSASIWHLRFISLTFEKWAPGYKLAVTKHICRKRISRHQQIVKIHSFSLKAAVKPAGSCSETIRKLMWNQEEVAVSDLNQHSVLTSVPSLWLAAALLQFWVVEFFLWLVERDVDQLEINYVQIFPCLLALVWIVAVKKKCK